MNNAGQFRAIAVAIASPLLLAVGSVLPVSMSSLGYMWGPTDGLTSITLLVAVILLAWNLISDTRRPDVASRIHIFMTLVTICLLILGCVFAHAGLSYFRYQTAMDMPSWSATNKDAFWNTLTGFVSYSFGDLNPRRIYEAWGPGFTFNGEPLYQNAINSLSTAQVDELIRKGGISYSWYPLGVFCFVGAAVVQVRLMLKALRRQAPVAVELAGEHARQSEMS